MAVPDELIDGIGQMFSPIDRRFPRMHDDSLIFGFGQYSALIVIYRPGPLRMGTIAEHLGISVAGATGWMDWVHTGWVVRKRSETYRRASRPPQPEPCSPPPPRMRLTATNALFGKACAENDSMRGEVRYALGLRVVWDPVEC